MTSSASATTISASRTADVHAEPALHVAIVGAGALGSVYGVRLAVRAGVDVTFVVRPARAASRAPIVLERVKGGARDVLEAPVRSARVPPDADVVLLAVGTEDLDAVRALLDGTEAPVVVLTPMMPEDWRRVRSALGARVLAAMPAVIAYTREDGVVRAWLPPRPTLIDEPRAGPRAGPVHALVSALREAGLPAQLAVGVHAINPASTVSFIGVPMALGVAGSVRALAEDDELLALAARSCHEGRALGARIGRADPFAALGASVATPLGLRLSLAVLGRLSPEAIHYAEEHFGRKLRAQNLLMAEEIGKLARAAGLPAPAFEELAARLAGRPRRGAVAAR